MATVVNPPSSRFRAAILQHGLSAGPGGAGGNTQSKSLQNPLLAGTLGDPSLNQNFGGGIVGGFLQARQAAKQHEAFQAQQQSIDSAMSNLTKSIQQNGNNPVAGYSQWVAQNPKDFMALHQAGIKPGELMQSLLGAQAGQMQTVDAGGGNQLIIGVGPDGKSFHQLVRPNNTNPNSGPQYYNPDTNEAGSMGRNGFVKAPPGFVPPGVANNQNTQAGANDRQTARLNAAAAAGWKQDTNGNWINTKAAGGPVDQNGNPAQRAQAKMSPQEEQYFGHALNLHDALSVLHDYSNPVANPITGRISTLGAKLFGINDDALIYQQALKAAKGEMASMGETGANNKFALQTKLDQLPVDYHSARAGLLGANVDLQNLRDTMGTRAAAVEAKGTMAPAIADKLADRAHVYVPSRANQDPINILKKNPDAMNDDQLDQVFQYRDTLKPNDRAIVMQQIARRVGTNAAAESAQPTQQPAPAQQAAPQQQPVAPAGQPLAPAVTPRPEPSAGVP